MRKVILVVCVVFYSLSAIGQSPQLKELWKLYDKKKYDEIIEKGEELLVKDLNNVEYNYWVGLGYYKKDQILESIPFFEKASMHEDPHSTIRARANILLGVCYYHQDEKEKSRKSLIEGKKVKIYKRINEGNEYWFERFGFDDFFLTWQKVESDHFKFNFQDTTDLNYKRFIKKCEEAYTTIDTFFNSKIERKIDYFVWTSTTDARNIIKMANAHAFSDLFLIHGNTNENEGHEIAHVISLNYRKDLKMHRFISEGTAVYFDQTHLDKDEWFEGILENYKIKKIDVKDVWLKWEEFPSAYSYSLGGLFVKELIKQYGQDKFLEFFVDQSYKNAKEVFGKGLEDFIDEFETKYNDKIKK
jgi:tetratricopeptide (TPR) repeat protein